MALDQPVETIARHERAPAEANNIKVRKKIGKKF